MYNIIIYIKRADDGQRAFACKIAFTGNQILQSQPYPTGTTRRRRDTAAATLLVSSALNQPSLARTQVSQSTAKSRMDEQGQ